MIINIWVYPKNSINFNDFGYFVVEKIPMFISSSSSVHKNNKLTIIAAMLFSKNTFSRFFFSPFEVGFGYNRCSSSQLN